MRNLMMVALLLVGLFFAFPVSAEESVSAEELLRRVDSALSVAEDFTATITLTTTARSGAEESRTMTVWQKGANQRMVKITAPARLRGVGLLAQSEGQLYIYLPSFNRVRRVAGQQRGEPFMGSNFTQDDLTRTSYGDRFRPELLEERDTHFRLNLLPLKPEDEPYSRLVIDVRKEDFQVSLIEIYEPGEAEVSRRLEARRFEDQEGQIVAMEIEAQDLRRQSRSVATFSDVQVNSGLSDSLFTQRYLQR